MQNQNAVQPQQRRKTWKNVWYLWLLAAVIVITLVSLGVKKMKKENAGNNVNKGPQVVAIPPDAIVRELGCGKTSKPLPDRKLGRVVFIVPPCGSLPSSPVEILDPDLYIRVQAHDLRNTAENTYIVEAMWNSDRAQNGIDPYKWIQWAGGKKAYVTETNTVNSPNEIRFINLDGQKIAIEVDFF